jgi:tight adherence protein B
VHGERVKWAAVALLALALTAATILCARIASRSVPRFLRAQAAVVDADLATLFIRMPARRIFAVSALTAVLVMLLLWATGVPASLSCLIGAVWMSVPRFVAGNMKRRRSARIAVQLPDALSTWASLLRSGQGLSQALAQVAEHQPVPMGDELRLVVRQCRVGATIESAFEEFRHRVVVADLTMLATLLRAARELGGNLAESLQRLAEVMRSRLAMEARIRALTAQGRLQGFIVGVLPVLLALVLAFMEPDAMKRLFTTPLGWVALAVIAALEFTGFILIRRIVSIEV